MLPDLHSTPNAGARASASSLHTRRGTARSLVAWASVGLLGLGAIGCGGDDPGAESPSGHGHIEIGSTNQGSGDINFTLPFTTVEVTEGEQVGSLVLWSGTNPALATVDEDDRGEHLYVLDEGVPISLELTAIDAGVRFQFDETTIDAPGESVEIGPAPFHTSGQWQVVLPEGVDSGEYNLSFRLTAGTTYAASQEATLTLVPSESHHGEDDDHGD
ncbi:MAG: hypothetical protein FJ144_14000 [Deltaproteobacteria bacterium]|nr:hypothetical protein [Deltaproteobacteria bacterium]